MKKINLLLISPSSNQMYTPSAPLGLSYIAKNMSSYVDVKGLDLNVFKTVFNFNDKQILTFIAQYIYANDIDIIGISIFQETMLQTKYIVDMAKQNNIITIGGGVYTTVAPEKLDIDLDYLIRGDGEILFSQLINLIANNDLNIEALSSLQGISYKNNRKWIHNGNSVGLIKKDYIIPKREIFNGANSIFRYPDGSTYKYSMARVITSRGCIYNCSFCTNCRLTDKKWFDRTIDDVMSEIAYILKNDPNIKTITFSDDQFLGFKDIHYEKAYTILKKIEELTRHRNFRLNFQVRTDQFLNALEYKPELAEVINKISLKYIDENESVSVEMYGRKMHGIGIDVGIESNLDRRLNYLNKGCSKETNIIAINKAMQMKVDLGVYMIFFDPYVTLEELKEEFDIYMREYIDKEQFSVFKFFGLFHSLVPYIGSPIYDKIKEDNLLVEKDHYTGFKFKDERVTMFYLLYNKRLNDLFGGNNQKEHLVKEINSIFNIVNDIQICNEDKYFLNNIVCEIPDEAIDELFEKNIMLKKHYKILALGR